MDADRGQDGASAVEFALVLPVLALLLFGIIQFGLVFLQTQGLEGAAREGGRVASVGADVTAISSAVRRALSGLEGTLMLTIDRLDSTGVTTSTISTTVQTDGTPSSNAADIVCNAATVNALDIELVLEDMEVVIPLWGVSQFDYSANTRFRCESVG